MRVGDHHHRRRADLHQGRAVRQDDDQLAERKSVQILAAERRGAPFEEFAPGANLRLGRLVAEHGALRAPHRVFIARQAEVEAGIRLVPDVAGRELEDGVAELHGAIMVADAPAGANEGVRR